MVNYLIIFVVLQIFKLLITFFILLNNIAALYTELYLKYYLRLLYIIWKLYVQEKKIILFFIYSNDKFLTL